MWFNWNPCRNMLTIEHLDWCLIRYCWWWGILYDWVVCWVVLVSVRWYNGAAGGNEVWGVPEVWWSVWSQHLRYWSVWSQHVSVRYLICTSLARPGSNWPPHLPPGSPESESYEKCSVWPHCDTAMLMLSRPSGVICRRKLTRFGTKVCLIGPKWDKSGDLFSDMIQYTLVHWAVA